MTPEEKDLLVKDLCARLPYGVKGLHRGQVHELFTIDGREVNNACIQVDGYDAWFSVNTFKPYLRPMSSMTKEEKIELKYKTCPEGTGYFDEKALICPGNHYGEYIPYNFMSVILNWLLAHHFDVRNLIEKGLALEAPKGMYETK